MFLFFLWKTISVLGGEDYRFRTMSPEGGFYYDGVNAIEQDSEGFIWVLMDYELYRFDGYDYKKYYPYFAAIEPTKRWIFYNLATDSQGHLYVNTNNGLYRYTQEDERFEWVYATVSRLAVDGVDNVWIMSNSRWGRLDMEAGILHLPKYDGKMPTYVNRPFCAYKRSLYSFIGSSIYRFDDRTNEFTCCLTLPNQINGYIRFAEARIGKLWVCTEKDGIYVIDLSSFKIEKHYNIPFACCNNILRAFFIDKNGKVWMGTIDGLYILNPSTEEWKHYTHVRTNPFSLPNNSIWQICEDRQSNIWIGTYSGHLCYVNLDERIPFESYYPEDKGLNYAPVSAFAEDDNCIWIGTEGGGINQLDKHTRKVTISPIGEVLSNVKSLLIDNHRNLWISTFRDGITEYNSNLCPVACYKHDANDPSSLLVNNVRKTVLEGDSGMWVAYQHPVPVISYFSFREKKFTHFDLDSTRNYSYLFDMMRQGENTLWTITNEALYRMDIRSHDVQKIEPNDSIYLGLFTFCLDDAGDIWIGTIGNGLVKYEIGSSQFISMKNKLPQEIYSIYSICYDNGHVWMGTDDGLFCYDIQQSLLSKFDKCENTQGQVYYPLSTMKAKNGLLYFGGTNGFTVVNPQQISYNKYKPKAILSNFFIDHKQVQPRYTFDNDCLKTIVLDYDQINFGFQFSSDNYHIPGKNRFKYRLKGYNDAWITIGAQQRTVMYSKVPPGTYFFEVCAANNDGIWNDTPTVVKIVRKAAPWFSLPAYLIYVLLLTGFTYLIYRHLAEKKNLQMMLYRENIEREKKEQIHQAQLRFFTNISHDFRTPLSLIMAALDKLRSEGLKEYYYRILNSNVQRLLNLVNELMDFRSVESGKMKLSPTKLNINELVKDIADDFADYARQHQIDFRIAFDKNLPAAIYADKNVVEKIVMNLLNNAFKYTADKGTIVLETRYGRDFTSHYKYSYTVGDVIDNAFSIIVSDTGMGISCDSISNVFERFYKVNTVNANSHLGTGIGLALVKSLVLLQKGEISIYSERNVGTDMVVHLPLNSIVSATSDFAQQSSFDSYTNQADEEKDFLDSDMETSNSGSVQLPDKKKVLIVEDNKDLRHLIAESLSDEFYMVQASDGIQALRLMDEMDFDLVISDIMMPHKDGVSLCSDIKKDINTSHIPVILLTAKTSLESKIEGVDSGADLYFEKPVDLTYLKLAVLNLFRNRQQLKEHYAKTYNADSSELSTTDQDNQFLKQLIELIEARMDQPQLNVSLIAKTFGMSHTKLYSKVKGLTGKTLVEFILNCRMHKAARLIVEKNMMMRDVMFEVGIESQSYFSSSFKKVFGDTPTTFASKHKKT